MSDEEYFVLTHIDFLNEINELAVKYGWNVGCSTFDSECESLTVTFIPAIGSDSQNRKF